MSTTAAIPLPARVDGPSILAVLAGGALGTMLRVLVDAALPHRIDQFALSTLLINVTGAFGLGLLVALLWPRVPGWARAGLGPGLLGTFTTFSALAVSVVGLAEGGDLLGALLTIAGNIGLGLGAAFAGLLLGSRATPGGGGGGPAPAPTIDEGTP